MTYCPLFGRDLFKKTLIQLKELMQLQRTKCTLDKLYFEKVYKRAESTDFILHN